tara:strand:- start:945 stop:1511 length:567 start_codon:yes stop_codon:yes gene_type:complete
MNKILSVFTIWILSNKNLIAAEAGMPQLDPTYWASQAFWLIIIFSSIYFLISKIFIPKIKNSIDSRENKIRKDIEEASVLKENAEKKLKEYDHLIKTAKIEAKKIIFESRKTLNESMEVKKKQIEKEIEKEIQNAESEIEKFKINSVDKTGVIAEEIASNLIENIFGEELNKSSMSATISETMKGYKN